MADTRKHDRETVGKLRDSARNTAERQRAERTLHQINSESRAVNRLREGLVGAVRNKDHRARAYFERALIRERREK